MDRIGALERLKSAAAAVQAAATVGLHDATRRRRAAAGLPAGEQAKAVGAHRHVE